LKQWSAGNRRIILDFSEPRSDMRHAVMKISRYRISLVEPTHGQLFQRMPQPPPVEQLSLLARLATPAPPFTPNVENFLSTA
jgi:hypothetical protein